VKYDDASYHSGGDFPEDSPQEYGGTHIGLFLRYCFTKGWAGDLHTSEAPGAVQAVIDGTLSGTEFLEHYCDDKLTNEDFTDEGNAFAMKYYGNDGYYLDDYAEHFGDLMYTASEAEHDFTKFTQMVDQRIASGKLSK
jgi:hypothetical protein